MYKYRVVQKQHKVCGIIILQPYITETCGFEQNVLKEIFYLTKVSVLMQQLNIFWFCRLQVNYWKTELPSMYFGP